MSKRQSSAAAVRIGSSHQAPNARNTATRAGPSVVPTPSRTFIVSTARSAAAGKYSCAKVFSVMTVTPNPPPSTPVAASSAPYATAGEDTSSRLPASSIIDARLAPSPTRNTRLSPHRRASAGAAADATMARATCGRNIAPYWVSLSPYTRGLVRMELAAGNVTKANPWMRPARYTRRISVVRVVSEVPDRDGGRGRGARGGDDEFMAPRSGSSQPRTNTEVPGAPGVGGAAPHSCRGSTAPSGPPPQLLLKEDIVTVSRRGQARGALIRAHREMESRRPG